MCDTISIRVLIHANGAEFVTNDPSPPRLLKRHNETRHHHVSTLDSYLSVAIYAERVIFSASANGQPTPHRSDSTVYS